MKKLTKKSRDLLRFIKLKQWFLLGLLAIGLVIVGGLKIFGDSNQLKTNISVNQAITSKVLGAKTQANRWKPRSVTPTPTPLPKPTTTPTSTINNVSWGAYTSWNVAAVQEFESKVGKPMKNIATFVHWGNENELPLDLGNLAKSRGQNLVLYWEAMDYNMTTPEDPRFSYDAILSGKWDSYLISFATQTKNFGGQVILIPFEEMNGDWYPWSVTKNNNSIAKHIAAYRYVRKFFDGIPNVKFGWTVNNTSESGASSNLADYYPGDQYVDIIGVNGFNFNEPWLTFSQIFDNSLRQLEAMNKPIMIFSMACAPGSAKAAWITDALGIQVKKHPKVIGWIWFNENKEKDWRVWSDVNSLTAFKNILP